MLALSRGVAKRSYKRAKEEEAVCGGGGSSAPQTSFRPQSGPSGGDCSAPQVSPNSGSTSKPSSASRTKQRRLESFSLETDESSSSSKPSNGGGGWSLLDGAKTTSSSLFDGGQNNGKQQSRGRNKRILVIVELSLERRRLGLGWLNFDNVLFAHDQTNNNLDVYSISALGSLFAA